MGRIIYVLCSNSPKNFPTEYHLHISISEAKFLISCINRLRGIFLILPLALVVVSKIMQLSWRVTLPPSLGIASKNVVTKCFLWTKVAAHREPYAVSSIIFESSSSEKSQQLAKAPAAAFISSVVGLQEVDSYLSIRRCARTPAA